MFLDGVVYQVKVVENLSDATRVRYRLKVVGVNDLGKRSDLEIGAELVHEEPAESLGQLLDGVFVLTDEKAA